HPRTLCRAEAATATRRRRPVSTASTTAPFRAAVDSGAHRPAFDSAALRSGHPEAEAEAEADRTPRTEALAVALVLHMPVAQDKPPADQLLLLEVMAPQLPRTLVLAVVVAVVERT